MSELKKSDDMMTPADLSQVASVMDRKYATERKQRRFEVTASKDATGVHAQVTLRNATGSFFYPVEGRLAHLDHDMTAKEATLFLLEYIDAYFAEFFREGGEIYLPIDWADYDFDGVPMQLKGQVLNLEIEKMADELLEPTGNPTLH